MVYLHRLTAQEDQPPSRITAANLTVCLCDGIVRREALHHHTTTNRV
jgi:hypothetical protein